MGVLLEECGTMLQSVASWLAGSTPLKNLSDFSISISDLEDLLRKLKADKIYWRKLSEEEFDRMDAERDNDIESGKINLPAPRRRRSDYGKKRPRDKDTESSGHSKKRNTGGTVAGDGAAGGTGMQIGDAVDGTVAGTSTDGNVAGTI
jgi:hypothetical protein